MNFIRKIFPDNINNDYKGNSIALYFFTIVITFTLFRSLIHIFTPDGGAMSIAGFPIENYGNGGKDTVILVFALWGLSQLLICIFYIVIFIKYRSLIPFMYLLLIFEYLMRIFLGLWKPAITEHLVPGTVGNYIVVPIGIILFWLSIQTKKK